MRFTIVMHLHRSKMAAVWCENRQKGKITIHFEWKINWLDWKHHINTKRRPTIWLNNTKELVTIFLPRFILLLMIMAKLMFKSPYLLVSFSYHLNFSSVHFRIQFTSVRHYFFSNWFVCSVEFIIILLFSFNDQQIQITNFRSHNAMSIFAQNSHTQHSLFWSASRATHVNRLYFECHTHINSTFLSSTGFCNNILFFFFTSCSIWFWFPLFFIRFMLLWIWKTKKWSRMLYQFRRLVVRLKNFPFLCYSFEPNIVACDIRIFE